MYTALQAIRHSLFHLDPVALSTRYVLRHGGLARLPIPGREIWLVSKPEYVNQVFLTASGNFDKSGGILEAVAADLGSTGLFNVNDYALWRKLRDLINPSFHPSQFAGSVATLAELWEDQLKSWPVRVNLNHEFVKLNVHFLMKQMFGQSTSQLEVTRLAGLAGPVFQDMFKRILLSLAFPPLAKKYTTARDTLNQAVQTIIRASDGESSDLLGRLKAAQQTDPLITNEVIRDQVFTMLMAGQDSSAAVTAWAALELVADQIQFKALQAEVLAVVGSNRHPTHEDLLKLPLLDEFLADVTRRHPAFPMTFRGAKQDHIFGEHVVKKGATIIINLDALHQSDDSLFASYGKGMRTCPAVKSAKITMAVPLVMMLQRYTWTPSKASDAGKYAMTRSPRAAKSILINRR